MSGRWDSEIYNAYLTLLHCHSVVRSPTYLQDITKTHKDEHEIGENESAVPKGQQKPLGLCLTAIKVIHLLENRKQW